MAIVAMKQSLVEEQYYAYLDVLSPGARFAMIAEMTDYLWKATRHQVRQEFPAYSKEQVKIAAARIIYRDDAQMQSFLNSLWEQSGG